MGFRKIGPIKNEDLEALASSFLRMSGIKTLRFQMELLYLVKREGFEKLGSCLSKLYSLENLDLGLIETEKMTDRELGIILKAISNLPLLNTLKLDFSRSKALHEDTFVHLATCLPKLKKLHTFSLNLTKCEISLKDEKAEKLLESISKLDKLQVIDFGFGLEEQYASHLVENIS